MRPPLVRNAVGVASLTSGYTVQDVSNAQREAGGRELCCLVIYSRLILRVWAGL